MLYHNENCYYYLSPEKRRWARDRRPPPEPGDGLVSEAREVYMCVYIYIYILYTIYIYILYVYTYSYLSLSLSVILVAK